jgi:glycosyltransferase involved in cell wall biosynthesis
MIDARGLAGRVIVAGFQQNPYPWMRNARLLVLCSDHEGLPNVLIEALALGTPVVSTDCPSGPREILGAAGAPWLVPCGDAAALAQAMGAALDQRPALDGIDLGRFDADAIVAQWEALPRRWRAPAGA